MTCEHGAKFCQDCARKRIEILEGALRQAALDITNLGAFLRLEGNSDLADIAVKMDEAAREALK